MTIRGCPPVRSGSFGSLNDSWLFSLDLRLNPSTFWDWIWTWFFNRPFPVQCPMDDMVCCYCCSRPVKWDRHHRLNCILVRRSADTVDFHIRCWRPHSDEYLLTNRCKWTRFGLHAVNSVAVDATTTNYLPIVAEPLNWTMFVFRINLCPTSL